MTTLSPTDITRAASVALALLLSAGIVKADNLSPDDLSGMTHIHEYAFTGADIAEADIPEGVRYIGEAAFAGSSLKRINLPSTLDSIGDYAFSQCADLVSVDLPRGIKHIGKKAFSGCTKLQTAAFPETLENIDDEAFFNTAIADVDLSLCAGLASVGAWTFAQSPELTSVRLPQKSIVLGEGVFFGCRNLRSVTSATTENLPDYMLAGSHGADASDLFGEGLVSIGSYCLSGNTALSNITLPSTLDSLGDHSMERMTALASIDATRLKSVPKTGENVWAEVDQPNVELTAAPDMTAEFESAPQWNEFHKTRFTSVDRPSMDTARLDVAITSTSIDLRADNSVITGVRLFDMRGAILMSATPESPTCSLDISTLDRGTYVLAAVLKDAGQRSYTFIKQ